MPTRKYACFRDDQMMILATHETETLCAGAEALLVSMWQVPEISTLYFMERFYGALRKGASKGPALRQPHIFTLIEESWLHPAFWGAYQFIGDGRPLSIPLTQI